MLGHLASLEWWQTIGLILDYAIKIIAVGVVPAGQKPSSSSAWLLAILFIPVIGLPLWLFMGSPFINRRRHAVQIHASAEIGNPHADLPVFPASAHPNDEIASFIRLNRTLTGMPAVWAENKGLYTDYVASIEAMAKAVDAAKDFVHVEFYIIAWDDVTDVFFDALRRAAARGVDVKLLFDQVGSFKYPGYLRLGKRLRDAGIDWHLTQPLAPWKWRFRRPDLRNHRKMLIIDGRIGFMGSQNLIEPAYLSKRNARLGRHWHDLMVELTGSVVTNMNTLFATDWYLETGDRIELSDNPVAEDLPAVREKHRTLVQLVPSGPGYTGEPNLKMFNSLVHHAKHTLVMCSPYFIPDESLLQAVATACYRGVDVHLLVSEQSDQFIVEHAQSSYYGGLLNLGVTIHRYPAPKILHTKFMLADPEGPHAVGVLGSSNMDMRSFGLNYEVSLMVSEGTLINDLTALFQHYMAESAILTKEKWKERGLINRYLDNALRLTSALQ